MAAPRHFLLNSLDTVLLAMLRLLLLTTFSFSMVSAQIGSPGPVSLMPQPAHLSLGSGSLRIDASFRVALTGYGEPRLRRAATRTIARLGRQTGIALESRVVENGGATLVISCDHAGKPVQTFGEDESYRLEVASSGARLSAPEPLGILRGLETFLQLVVPAGPAFAVPAVTIDDAPRFPWRGLLLDASRHFMPVDSVERTLDGMAAVKLNVFHWHLSDNQGFRVESRAFPRLHGIGSSGLYYTEAQVRAVVAYAHERGIRVVPEFDMPGHTTAMLAAYPALATDPAPVEVDHTFGVLDPAMDPSKPAVYLFLDKFIAEMAQLFPDSYLHIGGDEVNGKLWRESPRIQQFKQSHGLLPTPADPDANAALHAMFNTRLEAILRKYGKHMMGWDEILSPALPKDTVIQSWRGQKSLGDAVRLGFRALLSSGYYLDLIQPASDHYLIDPLDKEAASLSPEEQSRVLGGEAAMWSELVTPETLDSRIWPRAAAVAERLWSPGSVRDVPDMYRRLEIVSRWLEWLDLTHRSWQPSMLARLTGNENPKALLTFAELVEPVRFYERQAFGPYTTSTPLNQFVDAVPPESEAARAFAAAVTRDRASSGDWEDVRLQLQIWRSNLLSMDSFLKRNPQLEGLALLRVNALAMVEVGIEAESAIESGRSMNPDWKSNALKKIDASGASSAALHVCIAPAISALIHRTL